MRKRNRNVVISFLIFACVSSVSVRGLAQAGSSCPITTDEIASYPGPFNPVVAERKQAVVAFRTRGPSPQYRCSGTLITNDLVLTAGHCEDLESLDAVFGLERVGLAILVRASYPVVAIVESGVLVNGVRYDYQIVRLGTDVAAALDIDPTPVRAYLPEVGAPAIMMGHPWIDGEPNGGVRVMQAASGAFTEVPTAPHLGVPMIRASINSRSGASGSGLLDQDGALVGVMTLSPEAFSTPAACWMGFGAVPLYLLAHVSPTIRSLARPIDIKFEGRRVNDAQLYASCGSGVAERCYRRVTSYEAMPSTQCHVSCPPGAQLQVYCDIMRPSRNAGINISELNMYRTQVQTPGVSYTTSYSYQSCYGKSCGGVHTVDAPMTVTCRLDD